MIADTEHIHHRLMKSGLSQRKAATFLYCLNLFLVVIGLLSLVFRSNAIGIYLVSFVIASYLIVRHLARIELWDSGYVILKGLHRPPGKAKAVMIYPILDCALLAFALAISIFLVHIQNNEFSWLAFKGIWFDSLPIQIGIPFIAIAIAKTYSRVWSRARVSEFAILALAILGGILMDCGLAIILRNSETYKGIILQCVIYAGISIPLLTGSRAFLRTVQDIMLMEDPSSRENIENFSKVLLYGAGSNGILYLRQKYSVRSRKGKNRVIVGFVDDDRNLRKRLVHGYQILGARKELGEIINQYKINEIVITTKLAKNSLNVVMNMARKYQIKVSVWYSGEMVLYKNGVTKRNKVKNQKTSDINDKILA